MFRKVCLSLLAIGFVCSLAAAVRADTRVSASKKGSLLYFSKIELKWDSSGKLRQDTFVSLINDYPDDVFVQMYFVNGDAPLAAVFAGDPPVRVERAHSGWNWVDFNIHLTENESTYYSAATGMPLGAQPFTILDPGTPNGRQDPDGPPGQRILRGFIIAFAVDNQGNEISWNHLSGAVDIVSYGDRSAWEYNSYAFQAINPALGQPTDAVPGQINLDGIEYDYAFDKLLLDFYAVGSTAFSGGGVSVMLDTDLTLHAVSVDLRQDSLGPVTTKAKFDIWNQNEDGLSEVTRCITCWDQTLLSNYGSPNNFLIGNMHTDKGKARIDGVASDVCNPPELCCHLGVDRACFPIIDHPTIDPECSINAAILGVVDKVMAFSGGQSGRTDAGMTLIGQGQESATILRDIVAPPGTLTTNMQEKLGAGVNGSDDSSVSSVREMSQRGTPKQPR